MLYTQFLKLLRCQTMKCQVSGFHMSSIKSRRGNRMPRAVFTDSIQQNHSTIENAKDLLKNAVTSGPKEHPVDFPSDITDKRNKYKNYNDWKRDQARHGYRPEVDPEETTVLLFPGQGAQFVGMGKKLLSYPNVPEMFQRANKILGYDLLDVCMNGPKEQLDKTEYCQPAIFVTSLAAVEKLKEENPKAIENCVSAAGFSVGEFAALVFAGSLTFEEGIEVVKRRAEAMQSASELIPSGMMSCFLTPHHRINFACHAAVRYCRERLKMEDPVCNVANFLYPDCKVIAGNIEALDFMEKNAADFGIRRTKRLTVSGAFHTSLMRSACADVKDALEQVSLKRPLISVFSNVTSHRYQHSKTIPRLLVDQLREPLRWEQTMHVLYARKQGETFPYTYELGPGRQLGTLLKMVNGKAYLQYRPVDV